MAFGVPGGLNRDRHGIRWRCPLGPAIARSLGFLMSPTRALRVTLWEPYSSFPHSTIHSDNYIIAPYFLHQVCHPFLGRDVWHVPTRKFCVYLNLYLLFKISSNGNFRAKTLFLLRNEFLGFQNPQKISPQARRAGLRPAIAGPGKPRDELRPALLTPRSHSPKTAKRFKSAM